uniref:Heat shock protein 70 n=1 Tax=Rhabditophanes sp. KR3021 TaxID=114890 RepID=A0AC35U0X6_9BILA
MASYVIGIDLGTTYSCVAVYKDQKVMIITNEHGLRTTPSVVCFIDAEILVGQEALDMLAINPTNVIYDSKRLIGRIYTDPIVQGDVKNYPFKVTNGKDDRCLISVERNEADGKKTKLYTPEEIAAHVLKDLKKTAERSLGCKITEAVITVPAYFNNCQKQATKNAGEIAGLKVLKVLTEPTSAALLYAHNRKDTVNGLVLVFDLGGGTLDVSIVRIDNSNIEVLSTSSDTHLGGSDFDSVILEYAIAEIVKKYGIDVLDDSRAKAKLKVECEKAKRTLSITRDANIIVPNIINGIDIQIKITREIFNSLCSELFARIDKPIDQALEEAKLTKDNIDKVLLVGGSTKVPKVKEQLGKYFPADQIIQSRHPDEIVAIGAAIYASQMSSNQLQRCEKICLKDVVPLPLDVKISEEKMHCIIDKNAKSPTITIEKNSFKMTQEELDKIIAEFKDDCKRTEEFKKAHKLKNICEDIVREIEEEIEAKSDKYNLGSDFMPNAKTEIKTYTNWANQEHTVLSNTQVKSKVNIVKNAIMKIVKDPETFEELFRDMTL